MVPVYEFSSRLKKNECVLFANRVNMNELIYLKVAFIGKDIDYGLVELDHLSLVAVINDVMQMVYKR